MVWIQIMFLVVGSILIGDATTAGVGWGVFFVGMFLKH